jgi:MFS family permease
MADKYGRKPVFILSIVGLLMALIWVFVVCKCADFLTSLLLLNYPLGASPDIFPVKLIWVGNIGYIVGGGVGVFQSMIFTFVADVVDEAQR